MKKNLLLVTCILLAISTQAQEGLKFGVQGGLAVNDYEKLTGIIFGVDFGYMHSLNEVVDVGVMVGYIHGFPEKYNTTNPLIDLPSIQFLPISASLRIWTSNSFSFGGNVGQAFGLNEGNDGGFYYRPQIGYLMSSNTEVNLSYTAIALENNTWSTLTFGITYTFVFKSSY